MRALLTATVLAGTMAIGGVAAGAAELESQRLDRAKDLIADERWLPAIQELKAAAEDPKEPNRDEALFWLAHSQHQARQSAAAVETIGRLEREFPRSRWTRPARSLRLEIAQRLNRFDVLWYTAAPPTPAPAPPAVTPSVASPQPVVPPAPPATAPRPSRPAPPSTPPPPRPAPVREATVVAPVHPSAAVPPQLPSAWVAAAYPPDVDLRIQALGSLMRTDAETVIPMLKEIALESENPGQARRALFVLAQSGRPEARSTVVEVARTGSEPVRIAAVRELGRLSGPGIANELLHVYSSGNEPVKYQVVSALGEQSATMALMRIAQSETSPHLREAAIVTLGHAGGRQQLSTLYTMYARARSEARRPIIVGLFNAQADAELIRIADRERDPALKQEILAKLRLLGTPQAKAYLEKVKATKGNR